MILCAMLSSVAVLVAVAILLAATEQIRAIDPAAVELLVTRLLMVA